MTLARQVMNRAVVVAAPLEVAASDAYRLRDGEAAPVAVGLLCAACHGDENVRLQDALGDLGFCDDCLDGAQIPLRDVELGGEC